MLELKYLDKPQRLKVRVVEEEVAFHFSVLNLSLRKNITF